MRQHHTVRRKRSGTVYITVLIVAMVVALMAAATGRVARIHLLSIRNEHDREVARTLASSAIDHALVTFNNEPSWESTYSYDVEYPNTPVAANDGTFTWKLVDESGGRRRLDGIGRVNDAECILSVDLGVVTPDLLSFPLLVGGDLSIGDLSSTETLTVSDGSAVSNGDLKNSNLLTGDVEAQTESVMGTITGTKTVPGTVRALPRSARVFAYYRANGTVIPNASLPTSGVLQHVVLSPAANPYGAANPDGIYIIDSPGVRIKIQNSRVVS